MPAHSQPKFALDVFLSPKTDQQDATTAFLHAGKALVVAEPDTLQWFGYKIVPDGPWCIFDTFAHEEGRTAHVRGEVAKALFAHADTLLSAAPEIAQLDVIAHKTAGEHAGLTVGVRVIIKAKEDEMSVAGLRALLAHRGSEVAHEEFTPYWYAFQKDATTFGLLGVFYNAEGRNAHVAHTETQTMMTKMSDFTEGGPEVSFFDILTYNIKHTHTL
ncbi:hypothetical protein BV25DRAFT_1829578 [Artomyces pyxidatus]|uniref:Uncharacterized protein n=1 Tax=Artomyces pyxidatus TaxID=48021 RepID=A0ACB8SRV4_9AGAM|nr:hypothetical protein BV25DRAFT_1829578 [Artomyces pyxidatus]